MNFDAKVISLKYTPSTDNAADKLTKNLFLETFQLLCNSLLGNAT